MDGVRTYLVVGFIFTLFITYVSGGGIAGVL
jgi:hypothetical protein